MEILKIMKTKRKILDISIDLPSISTNHSKQAAIIYVGNHAVRIPKAELDFVIKNLRKAQKALNS